MLSVGFWCQRGRDVLGKEHEHAGKALGHARVDARSQGQFIIQLDQLHSLLLGWIELEGQPTAEFSGPVHRSRREVTRLDGNVEMFEDLGQVLLSLRFILHRIRQRREIGKRPWSVALNLMFHIRHLRLVHGDSAGR